MSTDLMTFVKGITLPTHDDLSEKIRNIQAARHGGSLRTLSNAGADNTKSAQVNAGSLTSFTENLTGQSKSDVKNSTLLAQLAADKAHDRFAAPMDWYKFYLNILSNIGWNQPSFAFDDYTSGGSTVQVDEAVLGILAAIATQNEVAIVQATMEGLKALGDGTKQMAIWNANASNGSNGNFQIMPVDQLDNGDVVMVLTGMQFTASTSHGGFLWWSWSSTSIKIQRAASKFVLNEDVYAKVRQQIVDKLGDRATQFVADIDIG
jgi:hypothetical protein